MKRGLSHVEEQGARDPTDAALPPRLVSRSVLRDAALPLHGHEWPSYRRIVGPEL
ncbi:MAG: hypothetical protein QOC98_3256 [Frankiaceae bacterium]|nr:hypothetical protein [Frankiaceae bacterium]